MQSKTLGTGIFANTVRTNGVGSCCGYYTAAKYNAQREDRGMWDFSVGSALKLMMRTLPFIGLRLVVYFGITLGYILVTGVGAGIGYGEGTCCRCHWWISKGRRFHTGSLIAAPGRVL